MQQRRGPARTTFLVLITALAVLAALAGLPAGARAEEPSLEVLQVGWDGMVVPGTWSPVRLRVVGGITDTSARVEVVLKSRVQPGPQATTVEFPTGAYGQEVALPAGVAKEVTLWVPADNAYGQGMGGTTRLLRGQEILAELKLDFKAARTPYWPLVGVLADSPGVARALSQVELLSQGLPVPLGVARLGAPEIPASAERLRAFSALVVQGNAPATLTSGQRRAVQEWVAAGGHLLLAGGPDAARAAAVLAPGALEVAFSGAEATVDLSGLGRWAGAREEGSLHGPAARFSATTGSGLAGPADRPLAWRLGLGQGTVTLLAADPALEPLASWGGTPALLRKALEPALPNPDDNEKMRYIRAQEQDPVGRLAGALEALPPEAFPDTRSIALALGGFALVVGPLLHLLLWRVDRRVWIWAAVPALALLLAGALYYLGVGRGGQDVLVNVVGHLKLDPAGGPTRHVLAAGFYAPTHDSLVVTVPGDASVRAVSRAPGSMFGPGGSVPSGAPLDPPFHVISGRDTRVEFDSGRWAMRTVALTRSDGPETGRIAARLGLEGGLIKGSIQNDTPYLLEDAAVVVGQGVVKLGVLAPGQSIPVVLDPGPPANPFGGSFPLSWRLLGRPAKAGSGMGVAQPLPAPPPGVSAGISYRSAAVSGMPEQIELPQDPEVQRRVRLLDPIVNVPRMGPGNQALPLTFLAFTRAPVGRDLPSAGRHPTHHLTLVEQPLRLDLPPGPFTMSPALIPSEIQAQSGGYGGGGNGTLFWIQINGGSVVFVFWPPLPPRSLVEALTVTTQQVGTTAPFAPGRAVQPPPASGPGPAEADVFSAYNWQSAAWDPLPGGQEQIRLAPGAPYVGPDGQVRIQVSAGSDRAVSVVQPELTVEGRVVE